MSFGYRRGEWMRCDAMDERDKIIFVLFLKFCDCFEISPFAFAVRTENSINLSLACAF